MFPLPVSPVVEPGTLRVPEPGDTSTVALPNEMLPPGPLLFKMRVSLPLLIIVPPPLLIVRMPLPVIVPPL
jgi:hypothetical protein